MTNNVCKLDWKHGIELFKWNKYGFNIYTKGKLKLSKSTDAMLQQCSSYRNSAIIYGLFSLND